VSGRAGRRSAPGARGASRRAAPPKADLVKGEAKCEEEVAKRASFLLENCSAWLMKSPFTNRMRGRLLFCRCHSGKGQTSKCWWASARQAGVSGRQRAPKHTLGASGGSATPTLEVHHRRAVVASRGGLVCLLTPVGEGERSGGEGLALEHPGIAPRAVRRARARPWHARGGIEELLPGLLLGVLEGEARVLVLDLLRALPDPLNAPLPPAHAGRRSGRLSR
jgi:hypothetical protein